MGNARGSGLAVLRTSLCAFAVAGFTTACADLQTLPPAKTVTSETVLEGLQLVETVTRGRLFVKPDHHLGSYDGFMIEPIQLSYKRGQTQLTPEDAKSLGLRLRELLSTSISTGGLEVATKPHECIVGLRLEIFDLEMLDLQEHTGAATRFIESSGGAILVFEFRDSLSGETLTRYGQRRRLPGGRVTSTGGLSSAGLVTRLGEGLVDMGLALRKVIPTTTSFREGTSCTGKIGQQQGYDAQGRPASPTTPLPGNTR
jgi:hypothetical protein